MKPEWEPPHEPLFGEKEGKIAKASRGRDPLYLFAALQRQLGYPEVQTVISQNGRPDDGTDPSGFYNVELFAPLAYRFAVYGTVQFSYFLLRRLLPLVNTRALDADQSASGSCKYLHARHGASPSRPTSSGG